MKQGADPEYDQALAMALKMLRARNRLSAEVRARCLSKGCNHKKIEAVLYYLVQKGILKDDSVACDLANSWLAEKGWGPLRIETELCTRGLDPQSAAQVAESRDYSQAIQKALKKQNGKSPEAAKRSLYQLGYPPETFDQFNLE